MATNCESTLKVFPKNLKNHFQKVEITSDTDSPQFTIVCLMMVQDYDGKSDVICAHT